VFPPAVSHETPNGPIRVLFVIGSLEIGGAEKQLVEIALGLDRERFAPAVCSLAAGGPLAAALAQGGVPVIEIGFQGAARIGTVAALAQIPGRLLRFIRAVRAFRPDVLHGVLFHAYVLGAIAGVLTRVPIVVASRRSLSLFKKGRVHFRVAEWVVNRFTDAIVANSEAVRADAVASEGLSPEAVLVIHNGIDAGRYLTPRDPELRRSLAPGDGPVAIVVANFIHYKGHGYFLEAWAEVCRQFPGATALLVGDGPLRAHYEAEAVERGLGARVRFLGSRTDVPRLLAAADLLVHPSLEEGFSNALLEAMAAGLPVVATTVGGNAEAVRDGSTGHLVPPRDSAALAAAVLEVFSRPDRGRSLGDAGRRRILQHFELSGMVRQYEELYLRLLAQKDPRQHHVRNRGAR